MPRLSALTIAICLLLTLPAGATDYTFDYTAGCAAAYKAYLALRPDEGDAILRREILAHPYNLMAVYIADYGDFLPLLFNGDPYQRAQRSAHEGERLARLAKGPDDDPWKRLAQAGIHLHWALIHVRSGEQLKAALAFRRSYILLKENAVRFPKFAPNAVLYGAEEAVAGTIPDDYDWLMAVFGMKGNLPRGAGRLAAYLKGPHNADDPLHEEAVIYDAYIRFYLGGERAAVWQYIGSDASFPIQGNLLRMFIRANIALSFRRADAALGALYEANSSNTLQHWPVFDYELGCARLLRLDAGCITFLERYVANNTGRLFTKDALQKIALARYLQHDLKAAGAARARILREGSLNTDADRQAQRFAKEPKWPDLNLLSARLLIDGGEFQRALAFLHGTNASAFTDIADRLEYDFRLGRALEDSGDAAGAVQAYQRVINAGKARPEHFAARSALQMGGIYEARGQREEARRYYRLCLSIHNHDLQASIDQQAKAGLGRVGG